MTAESLMFVGGLGAFLITLWWVRSRDLREKYAVIWLSVGLVTLICGLFPGIIMTFADTAHLAYPSAVLFLALGLMYLYAFTVSVSLTRQYRKNVRLVQEVALLEDRLRIIEAMVQVRQ